MDAMTVLFVAVAALAARPAACAEPPAREGLVRRVLETSRDFERNTRTWAGSVDWPDLGVRAYEVRRDGKPVARVELDGKGRVLKGAESVPDGTVREYCRDGFLLRELPYRAGRLDGVAVHHLRNGMRIERPYVEGRLEGYVLEKSSGGRVVGEYPFIEGELTGISRLYASTGKPSQETPHLDGFDHGVLKRYYGDGQLFLEERYVRGRQEGTTRYYDKGRLVAEIPYRAGKRHGDAKGYREDLPGTLRVVTRYERGEAVELTEYGSDGRPTGTRPAEPEKKEYSMPGIPPVPPDECILPE